MPRTPSLVEDLLEEITTLARGGQLGAQGSGALDDPPGTGKSGPEDPTGKEAGPSIKNLSTLHSQTSCQRKEGW